MTWADRRREMIGSVTDIMPGAEKCVNKCAKVDEEDNVLIITDNTRIARALSSALKARRPQGTGAVECFYIGGAEDGLRPNQDLPSGLEHALQQATIVFNAFNAFDRDWPFVKR